ncbi:hypothetical protein ACQ4PT_049281 [Festuca glaucescens]
MANFAIDPLPFVPQGFFIREGGEERVRRTRVLAVDDQPLQGETFALATVFPEPQTAELQLEVRTAIRRYLRDTLKETILLSGPHPLGVGLFQFTTVFARDRVVKNLHSAFPGPGGLSFINQDEGRNARSKEEPVQCWVILLGIPHQLINQHSIEAIVKSFGGVLLFWHEPAHSYEKVIIKCLVENLDHIPRDIIFGKIFSRNGFRRSWTITAYPLIGDVQPAHMPPTEDLPLDNIDAHPFQGPVLPEHPVDAAWNALWSTNAANIAKQSSGNVQPVDRFMSVVTSTAPTPSLGGGHTSVVISPQAVGHNQGIFLKTPEESSSEWSEPLDLAEAAKDLKLAGYTEVEILATLEEFKRSGKPYYPGSPPWMPKLPVNMFEAAKGLKSAGYSDDQIASFLEDFKKFGIPYVSGSPLCTSKWTPSCHFMTLHAGSTPANALLSLCKTLTPADEGNLTTLQDLLVNLSGGPLKRMLISTRNKRALADQFVKKLSATINLGCHMSEAKKITKKLAFSPLSISRPAFSNPNPPAFNRFCNRQGILITYHRRKRHGTLISARTVRRSPRLSNRADGYRLTTDVCSQKICKSIPMEARQNTLFKRSSPILKMISSATLPERKNSDMAIIPNVSPLHRKPAPDLPVENLRALGTNFCGIPPEEFANDKLLHLIVPNEDVD